KLGTYSKIFVSWKFPIVGLPLVLWKILVLSAFPLERVLETRELLHEDFLCFFEGDLHCTETLQRLGSNLLPPHIHIYSTIYIVTRDVPFCVPIR
ncbi:hypothetical protein DVH24_009413, partial [Malus domestica]